MSEQYENNPPIHYLRETSTLAVFSLIASISSYLIFPLFGAIAGVITGHIAKRQIKESRGRLTGDGMATWALILGWINIAFFSFAICIFLFLLSLGAVSISACMVPFFEY